MKRRDFVTSVLAAGLAAPIVTGFSGKKGEEAQDGHGGHGNSGEAGKKLRNIAVSFGHWGPQDTPAPVAAGTLDRFTNGNDRTRNDHQIIPNPVKVHAGDSISFIISGFHNPQIFGPGTQPQDIDRTVLAPPNPAFPAAPPIIADTRNRVFRGADPRNISPTVAVPPAAPTLLPVGVAQDRIEVVSLTNPGRYLVICGVLPHFFDAPTGQFIMFGFIDVEPAED
jgi:hypothetical protein